jgi:hypothetical protein
MLASVKHGVVEMPIESLEYGFHPNEIRPDPSYGKDIHAVDPSS